MRHLFKGLLLIATVSSLVSVPGCRGVEPELVVVMEQPFTQVVVGTGRLVPARVLQVQSQVTARVMTISAEEGGEVSSEDVIATLDGTDAMRRLSEARSSLALAQARSRALAEVRLPATREELRQLELNRERLTRTVARQEALHQRGSLPLDALEETKTALELTESQVRISKVSVASRQPGGAEAAELAASVAQAQTMVRRLEQELSNYELCAPFDAVVIERFVEPGELIQSGAPLLVLGSAKAPVAEMELDERIIGLIEVGQTARVWPEAYPAHVIEAKVESVAPRVSRRNGTVRVRLVLEEEPRFAVQELTARIEIVVRTFEKALVLPVELLFEREPATVMVLSDGVTEARVLKVEQVAVDKLLILEGLEPQDVVVHPASGLSVGDKVAATSVSRGGAVR